jgi:hypothetical protein
MFRSLDSEVWFLDKPFKLMGFELGGRMTIVKLGDGSLLMVSPVAMTSDDRAELDRIGPVRHIVAPNLGHHLYVGDAKACYPDAMVYLAPGLAQKRTDLTGTVTLSDQPPAALAADLEQHLVQGMPKLNEVVFFHKKSRTLIQTDLAFNLVQMPSLLGRILFTLNGALGGVRATKVLRSLIVDKAATRRSIEKILAWDFDRMIITHGDVVRSGAKAELQAAYQFLLGKS